MPPPIELVGGPHDGRTLHLSPKPVIWLPKNPDELCVLTSPNPRYAEYQLDENRRYIFKPS